MIKFLKLAFILSYFLLALLVNLTSPKLAAAQNPSIGRQVAVETEFGNTDFGGYISQLMSWLVTIAGSLALLMLVYAGFIYITSSGNPEALGRAKDIIIGVVVGVLLLFLIEVILVKVVGIKWQLL
jgi:hypothetical protein